MKELLEFIAKELVDEPDKVTVTVKEQENFMVLELRVADTDMGKVIGKQGRIAQAIRTVMKSANIKNNKKIAVEILQ